MTEIALAKNNTSKKDDGVLCSSYQQPLEYTSLRHALDFSNNLYRWNHDL